MKLSATSSAGLPPSTLPAEEKRAEEGGERERPSRSRPSAAQSAFLGAAPSPARAQPHPPASALGRDPREERAAAAAAAGDPDHGVRRRRRRRSARASPGAIGYRFSCLSLGAPGEQGLHRPAGAPASIAPLSPPQRGEGGRGDVGPWRQVGLDKPGGGGSGPAPRSLGLNGGGDAGARLPPASPSGVAPNP